MQNENTTSLSDFAQHVLKQICSQEWVLERCLQNSEQLCEPGMLIDPMLTSRQAQKLLHMICYPNENDSSLKTDLVDQKSMIVRILEHLEQWTLRISWLDLQLMYKQTANTSSELSAWLDTVAKAAIDVFQLHEGGSRPEKTKPSIWLVAPLVSKLPAAVQGRILRVAGHVLEDTNLFSSKNKENDDPDDERSNCERKKTPQLNHQPFLGLVLTCLKGQDEQKESLLQSLHSQLSQFVQSREMETIGGIEDPMGRETMLDALQLRFSLVGGMFDAIQKNASSTNDWAVLLAQLISQGVIDLTNNSNLFTTVLDMLATLIHSTLISDSQSDRDENKKLYTNLMKKLKKELADRNNTSIKHVRQLLPLAKQTCEVIACEPLGALTDTKGNKISGFDSIDKKVGLRLQDKQRVSVWDLLEGHKNPAPLSWAWFGAVKMERKPLVYEESHRLLKYHTHSLVKPTSYFYEPLPLPPEDLEPEKPKDEKADTPTSLDQSPSGRNRGGKGMRKPPRKKPMLGPMAPMMGQPSTLQQQLQQPTMAQMGQYQPQQQQQQHPGMNPMNQFQVQGGGGVVGGQPGMMNQQMAGMGPQGPMMGQPGMGGGGQMMMPNQGMNPMGGGPGGGNFPGQMGQMPPQQMQQNWGNNYGNQMIPQQQQAPQFYQAMNRFDRPQMNPSKAALTNMLRQRHPQANPMFGMPGQQQQPPPPQFLQNRLRMGAPPQNQMPGVVGGGGVGGMNQMMAGGGGQNMMPVQGNPQMGGQSMPGQAPQSMMGGGVGQVPGQMGGGLNQMMNQPGGGGAVVSGAGGGMINQQMQFQQQQQQSQAQNQYQGGFQPGMVQQGVQGPSQQQMMGNFAAQRNQQAEYLAQQRAMQAQRQQQQQQGQYMQPNVAMNQGAAPPYGRQGQGAPVTTQQQQQQQQYQAQRLRHQMMLQQQQQQQQGMVQQQNNQGMVPNQGINQQQSALVAQLQQQRQQLPNQNAPNQQMMSQFGNQQPPPY